MKNIKYIIAFGALVLMAYTEKANAQGSNNSNANTMGITTATNTNTIALVNHTQTTPSNFISVIPICPSPQYISPYSFTEIQLQSTVTQIQSSVLPPQASTQPQVLNLSSTLVVQRSQETTSTPLLNTNSGFGTPAPLLQIQNGGMQLPLVATSITE